MFNRSALTSLAFFSICGCMHAKDISRFPVPTASSTKNDTKNKSEQTAPPSPNSDDLLSTSALSISENELLLTSDTALSKVDQTAEDSMRAKCQGNGMRASVEKGLVLEGAWLYWQAQENGLEYALNVSGKFVNDGIEATSNYENLDFNWRSGFQVGVGYIFSQRQQWDLSATWTQLDSKASSSVILENFDREIRNLKPIWSSLLTGSVGDSASAEWHLKFNTVDGALGHAYYVGRYLTLKPFVGVRGAWIDQHYNVKYHSAHFHDALRDNTFKAHIDFTGAGLRAGSDLQWLLGNYFSISGSFSGSLIYGKFNVKQASNGQLPPEGNSFLELTKLNNKFHEIIPNLEGKLGIQLHNSFSCNRFRFLLGAFYHMAVWWDQNQLSNGTTTISSFGPNAGDSPIINVPSHGNLQFQGVSVDLRLEF